MNQITGARYFSSNRVSELRNQVIMKNSVLLFTLLLLAVSCKSDRKEYQLKLNKGKVYLQDAMYSTRVSYAEQGYYSSILTSTLEELSFKVLEEYETYYDMEVRYHNLKMRVLRDTTVHEFSSSKTDNPDDIYSSIMSKMVNKPFYIKLSKKGKVMEIKKIDGLFQNMFDEFPYLLQEEKTAITFEIKQSFGEAALIRNIELGTYIYPDKPVQQGDKWKNKIRLKSVIDTEIDTEYQLDKVFPAHLELSGTSSLSAKNEKSDVELQGMSVKYDMEGSLTSKLKVDLKTGWTVEAKIKQDIQGTAHIKPNDIFPSGAAIPIKIKMEAIISGL